MLRIETIHPEQVNSIFGEIYLWVVEALAGDNAYTPQDINDLCSKGKLALRLISLDDSLTGFFISSIIFTPQGEVFYGAWLGGRNLEAWVKQGLNEIERYAVSMGCIGFAFVGRMAWKKLLGYEPKGVYYYKKL